MLDLKNRGIFIRTLERDKETLESQILERTKKISELEQEKGDYKNIISLREHDIQNLKIQKQEIQSKLDELERWGFSDHLKFKLNERQIGDIPSLLSHLEDAEDRLKRWSVCAKNQSLESVEEKIKRDIERQRRIKGSSTNIKEAGKAFEKWFHDGFKQLFGTHNNEVKCFSQDSGSDFVISFDSENSSCKVVVECKSVIDTDEGIYSVNPDCEEEQNKSKNRKDQLEKGIGQLKKYLKKHEAQVGILVTSFDFEEELEQIKQKQDLDRIFVVKEENIWKLLILTWHVNKYSVPVEKPSIDMESMKSQEYEWDSFLNEAIPYMNNFKTWFDKVLAKSDAIEKELGIFAKHSSNLKKAFDSFFNTVEKKKIAIDFYKTKAEPLKLDSSEEVEVFKEGEIEN